MMDRDAMRARLLATFRVEAAEHLEAIRATLGALERRADTPGGHRPDEGRHAELETAFRIVHTLKGAARSVGLLEVERLCQEAESLLSDLTRGRTTFGEAALGALKAAMDDTARLIDGPASEPAPPSTAAGAAAVPEPPAGPRGPAAPGRTVRIGTDELDALLRQAEELIGPRLAVEARAAEAAAALETALGCRASIRRLLATRGSGGAVVESAASESLTVIVALERQLRALVGHLTADRWSTAETVDALLADVRTLRMSPATLVLDVFPRMVSDLTRQQGKNVRLEVHGGEVPLDRRVLETIKDPLIHLVRNAVDHGIEPPDARWRAGKPPEGRLTVSIEPVEGGRVGIRVEDDGAGIDIGRLREAAVRCRALSEEEARALPDADAVALVYRSGVSTSPIITMVSGHGLGLAIVKERVEALGGHLQVETRAGAGATFRMVVPATVSTLRGLLVGVDGGRYLVPLDAVETVVRTANDAVRSVEGRETVDWNGEVVPAAALADLLGVAATERDDAAPRVVVRSESGRAALAVETVLGVHDAIDKPFGPPLVRVRNVAGAALLGTGDVVLVLRPADLVRHARAVRRGRRTVTSPAVVRRRTVLVVDDSITTRVMEKSLFEAAGYDVRAAVDGMEAWTMLRTEAVDVVVSDIDMPRLNGFELTQRIRADAKLRELPVILVTALDSREDKEHGIEVGANAYVLKSAFDESNLLDIVRRLA